MTAPPSIDLAGLLLLACWNVLIFGAWVLALLRTQWAFSEVLLVAAIGWCCQVLGTQMVLGLLGLLWPLPLVALNLVIVACLVWLWKRQSISQLRPRLSEAREALRELVRAPSALFTLLLLGVWLVWVVWLVLILPPYAADEYYYHMPIAASIIQQGGFRSFTNTIPWVQAYPKNGELFAVWSSILFHRDTFADLAMLPFSLIGGLGLYVAARRLGAERPVAWLASCVFLFSPTVLIHMKTTYVDLLAASMWAAAIGLCLPSNENMAAPSVRVTALLIGCVGGVAAGTKYTGAAYVPILAILLLPKLLALRSPQRIAQGVGVFAVGCAAMGGVWYMLNLVHFQNPVWPFQVAFGGRTLFSGSLNAEEFAATDRSLQAIGGMPLWGRLAYTWLDRSEAFSIDERLGGLGPLWAVIGLPSAALWGLWALLQRRWQHLIVIGGHLVLLLITPFNWIPRYTMFMLALGGCGFAALSPMLRGWVLRSAGALIAALALFSCLNSVDFRYFSVPLIRSFAGMADAERTGMAFAPAVFGPSYRWITQHATPGERVAFGRGVWRIYPLYGAHFEREVISLPSNDLSTYVERLRDAGVRYILAVPNQTDIAALEKSASAKRVFSGKDAYVVYEIAP